ncbi:hypothetical protein KP509_26G060700 [Ceratopteris richardii]|nr:hypothetical protein KP509_26G060700 [Ceratopteris richardii]
MELSKVLDGFTVADTLVIKAQVQVIRENPHRPFRCLDCQYRRELVRVYMTNVEGICRRFVEEKREKIGKLMDDPLRWPSFRAFWTALDEKVKVQLSREKTEIILKAIVKAFFNEKEVTSTLVMDALYSGCKALDYRSKSKKGKANGVETEETRNPVVWVDKDFFVLAGDVLLLLDRAAHETLPSYKDEKGPQNRTKDGCPGDDFGKDTMERDERRLTELGRRTIEMFVLAHLFSNRVEVAYLEAVALKRQEELIREEEAAGQAEIELKARREAAEKEKRNKKKQAKQRRNNRKEKERDCEEKHPARVGQSRLGDGSTSSRSVLGLSKEGNMRNVEIVDDDDDLSVLDNTDAIVGTLRAALEEGDVDRIFWEREGVDFHQTMEASFSGGSCINSAENGRSNRKPQSVLDDSSSTCSSDSIPSNKAILGGSGRRSNTLDHQLPNLSSRVRGRAVSDRELRADSTKAVLRGRTASGLPVNSETSILDADTIIVSLKQRMQWLQQRLQEKEEEVSLLQQQLSLYQNHYGCEILKENVHTAQKDPKYGHGQVDSDSTEYSKLVGNAECMDDFNNVRAGSGEPAATLSNSYLSNGSCSETLVLSSSGLQSTPIVNISRPPSTSPKSGAGCSESAASLPSSTNDIRPNLSLTDSILLKSQSNLCSSMTTEPCIIRPASAPSPPEASGQSPPFQQQLHAPPLLARSVSATGRLGVTSDEPTSCSSQPCYPAVNSYRNAAAGVSRNNQLVTSSAMLDAGQHNQINYYTGNGSHGTCSGPLGVENHQSALSTSTVQRNLNVSGQAVGLRTKSESMVHGFGKMSLAGEPEKVGPSRRPEHHRSGMGLTFGTVTPEVLQLQNQQQPHPDSNEGSLMDTNYLSREPEQYRDHFDCRQNDNDIIPQQVHGSGHSSFLEQKGRPQTVVGKLPIGLETRERMTELPTFTAGMPEEFPHLDIINELLDEDKLLGAKALNAVLQQPVVLHDIQRMYGCIGPNAVHNSGERSDIVLPPDNGGPSQYSNSAETILNSLAESIQLHHYGQTLHGSGLVDGLAGHHWQGHQGGLPPSVTGTTGLQGGLDFFMGYPMQSSNLPIIDCPAYAIGQNGYSMYPSAKHP